MQRLKGLTRKAAYGLHLQETKKKAALLIGKAEKLLSGKAKEDQ